MTPTMPPTPVAKDIRAARSEFLELHGSLAVMNTYLKIALLFVSLACVGLIVLNIRTNASFRNLKPMVVGIDLEGRARAIPYENVEFRPQEKEIKYFLIDFVQRHYSRMRATMKEDYARSLYFLESQLADSLMESNRKSKAIEVFLAGEGEENDIKITSVSIEDLRTSPYRATVDFEKIYYSADRQESRREKYTANFQFIVKDHVSNEFIPVNPLGLTITYFREDQSFNR